jgi:hypothetical protein
MATNRQSFGASPASTKDVPSKAMQIAIAGTMPKRSVIRPVMTPPRPKPMNIMVDATDTAPRVAENSFCTIGSITTTDQKPTAPIAPISKARPSRTHA